MKLGFTLPLIALIILVLNTVSSNGEDLEDDMEVPGETLHFREQIEEQIEELFKMLEDHPDLAEHTEQVLSTTVIIPTEPTSSPVVFSIGEGGEEWCCKHLGWLGCPSSSAQDCEALLE